MKELIEASLDQNKFLKQINFKIRHSWTQSEWTKFKKQLKMQLDLFKTGMDSKRKKRGEKIQYLVSKSQNCLMRENCPAYDANSVPSNKNKTI